MQLHDAILSLCYYDDSEASAMRIFSGLADGTVAVTEVWLFAWFMPFSTLSRPYQGCGEKLL